ncbi:MAG: radical SAM protein [Paramuribaculum sp.]|nr:radical SAM protein [Paramuribaculum sp.]
MNIYRVIKYLGIGAIPGWLKIAGLLGIYLLKRRIAGVYLDPVLACNLSCKMCYFSDPSKRSELKGIITESTIEMLEKNVFPYTVKLQIGCGAEPTLYKHLPSLISRAKKSAIPYISLTTNGQLIASRKISLKDMVDAGLDEITLSIHGTDRETYEYLMPGAGFDLLQNLIKQLSKIKKEKGNRFLIRLNFTINSLNLSNLRDNRFWEIWEENGVLPDIIQLRPVQKIGESAWTDFDLSSLKRDYHSTIGNIVSRAQKEGITIMAPTLKSLDMVATPQGASEAIIEDISYCYVSPTSVYKSDYDIISENIYSYLRRHHTGRLLLRSIFCRSKSRSSNVSKKLNYKVS